MAVINKSSFTIYPESWAENVGEKYYDTTSAQLKARFRDGLQIEEGMAYGWTVGLDVPTKEEIKQDIEKLKAEMAG